MPNGIGPFVPSLQVTINSSSSITCLMLLELE